MPEVKKKNWETLQILPDLPLCETETAHFHFDEFATTLARLVADPSTRTPLTIGVSGAWGSGKTTLLQRVRNQLDETGKKEKPLFANEGEKFRTCKTVWFDAWKYNDEDELLVALVRVILNTMGRGSLGEQIWGEILDPTTPRYDVLATFINMFKLKFGGVEVGIDPNKYKTETEFTKHTAFFDHFDSSFEELLARWVHGKGNPTKIDETKGALVVFIDDLDRCLPEKTVQVLETVKLFLDKPGCVFVIGAHTQVIQEAVTRFYTGMAVETASDYLEKIIQLRFELPPILETQMGEFLDDQKTSHKLPPAALENWETIVAGAEINPRKVKTFINDLNLAWALLANSGQAENVERADFTRWQVLMRVAPESLKKQVYEVFDEMELRYKFVENLLAWASDDIAAVTIIEKFEFSKSRRLKRTLKKIGGFSSHFNAEALDAFIHLVAPPKPLESQKALIDKTEFGTTLESMTLKSDELLELISSREIHLERVAHYEAMLNRSRIQVFGEIEFVFVPRGAFLMGSRDGNILAHGDEKPQHTVNLTYDFWISQFVISNVQFASFLEATNYDHVWVDDWEQKPNHPIVNVSWIGVQAYCQWLNLTHGKELPNGFVFRLLTEAEWEKAARGEFGFEWPWGNEFDPNKCNSNESNDGDTTPTGKYSPVGDSPFGVADMAGNVWEWTQSLFQEYPYQLGDGRERLDVSDKRVLRGGSFRSSYRFTRCASRDYENPNVCSNNVSFRVCVAPIS